MSRVVDGRCLYIDFNADNVTVYAPMDETVYVFVHSRGAVIARLLTGVSGKDYIEARGLAEKYSDKVWRRLLLVLTDLASRAEALCIVTEEISWSKPVDTGAGSDLKIWDVDFYYALIREVSRRAGLEMRFVSPSMNSRRCPYCGSVMERFPDNAPGAKRYMYCPVCGKVLDRDVVAVLNMYRVHTKLPPPENISVVRVNVMRGDVFA